MTPALYPEAGVIDRCQRPSEDNSARHSAAGNDNTAASRFWVSRTSAPLGVSRTSTQLEPDVLYDDLCQSLTVALPMLFATAWWGARYPTTV